MNSESLWRVAMTHRAAPLPEPASNEWPETQRGKTNAALPPSTFRNLAEQRGSVREALFSLHCGRFYKVESARAVHSKDPMTQRLCCVYRDKEEPNGCSQYTQHSPCSAGHILHTSPASVAVSLLGSFLPCEHRVPIANRPAAQSGDRI